MFGILQFDSVGRNMGLDNFKNEDSQSPRSTSSNSGGKKKSSKNEPFKRVGFGKTTKVFQTEEDWERTVDYIENEMGFSIDEVMGWNHKFRHKALHVAIINSRSDKEKEFTVEKKCFVCGRTFSFPHSWDFMEYEGSPVCPGHSYEDVVDRYRETRGEYDGKGDC